MKAIVLGILEDWENGIVNLTPEQFNLVTVRISLNKGEALISWLAQREDTSIAKTMATALLTQGGMQAKGNFIQVVASKMNIFMDFQIRNLVCQHNIDFNTLDEQPTAIFIIVPDERLDRHMFISLFISQLYKALITKANGLLEKKLQKPVYFICDEFGNIPSIPNMDGIITVARSRNIYFMLIIQNYGQLEVKYSEKNAKTIYNNCLTHTFLQTMDYDTAEKYSKMIGSKTMVNVSASISEKGTSTGESIQGVRLISADDLMCLEQGNCIIISARTNPGKVKLLSWYQVKHYSPGEREYIPVNNNLINFEQDYYYDISQDSKDCKGQKQIHPNLTIVDSKTLLIAVSKFINEDKRKALDELLQLKEQYELDKENSR